MFGRIRFVTSKAVILALATLLPVLGVFSAFFGGQRIAVKRLIDALDRDDIAAIAASVDFDTLRDSVRDQILTRIAESGRREISLAEIDVAIRSNLTPDGFARVVGWRQEPNREPKLDVFSTRKFRVTFPDAGDFTFCRIGVVDWEVCGIVLPHERLAMILGPPSKTGVGQLIKQVVLQLIEVEGAATEYVVVHKKCPKDVEALISDNRLSPERRLDPWMNRILLACPISDANDVRAVSVGPDRLRDTEDDIAAP